MGQTRHPLDLLAVNKRKAKLSVILKYVSLKHVKSEILVDHRRQRIPVRVCGSSPFYDNKR
ncbi:MAG: hypothetical protein WCC17_14390 [Candidatus Nitrosopolaris sp.]